VKRALLVLGACGTPVAAPVAPPAPVVKAPPAIDAGASQEEQLAAIQSAMNHLDKISQQCWAKVAAERFDIEGALDANIEISPTGADVTLSNDTTHSPKLAACMHDVLVAYRWAPPLYGQSIRLPFKWRAPDGQNVLDRNLVPWNGQAKISLAVLMDETNTGNAHASMIEVGIQSGATTGMRRADRPELWYFQPWKRDDAADFDVVVSWAGGKSEHVAAGDMMYLAPGVGREVKVVGKSPLRAVVVMVPGGREGTARSGALPTPETSTPKGAPTIVHRGSVKQTGPVQIFIDGAGGARLAASILHLEAGTNVAEHVHANETEMLWFSTFGVETTLGTLTVAGTPQEVTDHSVVQIPPNTTHAFAVKADAWALQIYTPAGPEQRFKK
jgi:quercetin dioxygenase-like cupin family protein